MNKMTIPELQVMKQKNEKITMLTCYNYSMAKILNEVKIDVLLVGDSLGMVVLGYENTLPVTVDDVLYHTKAVKRGNTFSLLVSDMPFMSYHVCIEETIINCGRMIKEGGAAAVKIEGGAEVEDVVRSLVNANIPVMGHIGLMPQAVHKMGGYKVQGRKEDEAKQLIEHAQILEEAGAFSLVLEGIPMNLAKQITQKVNIPTFGIGAGKYCDGQVLVTEDILGLYSDFTPKFVKRYANLNIEIKKAVGNFKDEVQKGVFPDTEHSYD